MMADTSDIKWELEKLFKENLGFAHSIYTSLVPGTVVHSPLFIHGVLSLLYASGVFGEMTAEVDATIRGYDELLANLKNTENILLTGFKFYVNKKCFCCDESIEEFRKLAAAATTFSPIETESMQFASKQTRDADIRAAVDEWANDRTNGKIKHFFGKNKTIGLADENIVLVEAIYFKGFWVNKFNVNDTKQEYFYFNWWNKIKVLMMHSTAIYNYGEFDELGAKALELSYVDETVGMYIILPNLVNGLQSVETKFEKFDLIKLAKDLKKMSVKVALPKFKLNYFCDVTETFDMEVMFSENLDFYHSIPNKYNPPLKISKVFQHILIELDDEVDVDLRNKKGGKKKPKTFIADHPFLFLIMLKTPFVPIFVGHFKKHFV